MATVQEMITYAQQKAEQMKLKMIEIDIMLIAAKGLDKFVQPWKTVTVDYVDANTDYQVLLAEAEVILSEFPKSPDDVPVPEEP